MLGRIGRERAPVQPRERAVKSGPGSLVDIEFLAQVLQLRHGHADPSLRAPGTRAALRALAAAGALPAAEADGLVSHYDFLKRIELALQRDANASVRTLPASVSERRVLALWLGFADEETFWGEHVRRLHGTRALVRAAAGPHAAHLH
jgi:glutamate-ammonia-ligase adenylyltransferase